MEYHTNLDVHKLIHVLPKCYWVGLVLPLDPERSGM